jgi:hypothetical protein
MKMGDEEERIDEWMETDGELSRLMIGRNLGAEREERERARETSHPGKEEIIDFPYEVTRAPLLAVRKCRDR